MLSSQSQEAEFKGWLYKWTNYIKGYQKRYFILNHGFLSYYRSNLEIPHTCRGSINLQGAFIETVDATSFVVTNGGTQTFHLKALNEVDRQKWVTALELAKAKAIREYESDDESNGLEEDLKYPSKSQKGDNLNHKSIKLSNNTLGIGNSIMKSLTIKLEDLITCDDLINKHGVALHKAITELENALNMSSIKIGMTTSTSELNKSKNHPIPDFKRDVMVVNNPNDIMNTNPASQYSNTLAVKLKTVNERATLFKITANAVMNACAEYLELAQVQNKKWQKIIQHEREQKAGLEDMVEQLAKQHNFLEKAAARNMAVSLAANSSSPGKSSNVITANSQESKLSTLVQSAVSDEDEFFDANDVAAKAAVIQPMSEDEGFIVTLPRVVGNKNITSSYHRRTPSGISNMSEGAHVKDHYSSESSDKELDVQEATVKPIKDVDKINSSAKLLKKQYNQRSHEDGSSNSLSSSQNNAQTDEKAPIISKNAFQQLHHMKLDYALVIDEALIRDLIKGAQSGQSRSRRTSISRKPNMSLNLWSIIKNCIGKDLSKIPMPVNFSEPLSMLQRLTEDFEYSEILDRAAKIKDAREQMCYVAAFTVSSYSTTVFRTSKPFNPLLGETYECDRSDDKGWIMISEQVSHHPPTAAFYTESTEWVCWQEFTMSSKFRGKYLNIIPLGIAHLEFKKSGNHYTWRKVTSTVHNIIVGRLWMEHSGEMDILNHKTNDNCHLKYYSYSYFARESPRKVTGVVTDNKGNAHWVLSGNWDTHIECSQVVDATSSTPKTSPSINYEKPVLETMPPTTLWKVRLPPPANENMYYFTEFAIQLNEPESDVAPTDSRKRPDQRLLEDGQWEQANLVKVKLEDKQRNTRRQQEGEMEKAAQEGRSFNSYEPLWFKKQQDPYTGNLIHLYKGQYFGKKAQGDWSLCPDIYHID